MRRFLSNLVSDFRTTRAARSARRAPRRANLQVEGLEDRLVLSTASLHASTWTGPGDEGPEESITFVYGKLAVIHVAQSSVQITSSAKSSPSTPAKGTQGAGAGKVKFSEIMITKKIDVASPAKN
jgi:type VI protein secretion system component Hcp